MESDLATVERLIGDMCDRDRHRIEKYAKDIKSHYVAYRRRRFPRYSMDTKTFPTSFWIKAALKLMPHAVEPEKFVALQFRKAPAYPPPTYLITKSALDSYLREYQSLEPAVKADAIVHSQMELVRLHLVAKRQLGEILLDDKVELNPLVCYCLAKSEKLHDLANRFFQDARDFILRYPGYQSVKLIEQFLPELR